MKKIHRNVLRGITLALALMLLLGMVPPGTLYASAATTKDFSGSTVADLGLTATNATGSGTPTCSWTASGAVITGSLVGGKDESGFMKYYYASESTLTITNKKSTDALLTFKYSSILFAYSIISIVLRYDLDRYNILFPNISFISSQCLIPRYAYID